MKSKYSVEMLGEHDEVIDMSLLNDMINDEQAFKHYLLKELAEIKQFSRLGKTVPSHPIDIKPHKKQVAAAPIRAKEQNMADGDTKDDLKRLKQEIKSIYALINSTKNEIAIIRHTASNGEHMSRVSMELNEVVKGTEEATETILTAVETIEQNAGNLSASLDDPSQQAMALEITEQVSEIYQACSFQDLAGQRISKVLKAFSFIEERLQEVVSIWGGEEEFQLDPDYKADHAGDALLNGPGLKGVDQCASQSDVDELFD